MSALLQPAFDRVERHALLGVMCRDAVDGRLVSDGLQVELLDLWRPAWTSRLAANRSGVFALHAAPGLRGFGDDAIGSPPATGRWRLIVSDPLGRYLPTAASPMLPHDGLFGAGSGAVAGSPPAFLPFVPLYSAATRALPPAMQSLRTELRLADEPDRPASWARLELWLGSQRLAEGIADAMGRAQLIFPLPRPREAPLSASPAEAGNRFEWTVTLRAYWHAERRADLVPDLDDVLAQPCVGLVESSSPNLPLVPLLLRAGETLIARGATSSYLYVAP
jgi:hypothetical protein